MRHSYWGIFCILAALCAPLAASDPEHECLFFASESGANDFIDLETGHLKHYETYADLKDDPPNDSREPYESYDRNYEFQPFTEKTEAIMLIERETDTYVSVSENATAPSWSPNSLWLAYVDVPSMDALLPEGIAPELVLYDAKTRTYVRTDFDIPDFDTPDAYWSLAINWADDGTKFMVFLELGPTQITHLFLFSAPDLKLLKTYDPMQPFVQRIWTDQKLLLGSSSTKTFGFIDLQDPDLAFVSVPLETDPLFYFYWSPNEQSLVMYRHIDDVTDGLSLINLKGEVIIQDLPVPGYEHYFEPHHSWVDEQHMLVNVWNNGKHDLTLVNLQTGEGEVFLADAGIYNLSSDGRLLAISAPSALDVQLFDLTQAHPDPVRTLTLEDPAERLMWRQEGHALIVLMEDGSLQSYDYDADEWSLIANLTDPLAYTMRNTACYIED